MDTMRTTLPGQKVADTRREQPKRRVDRTPSAVYHLPHLSTKGDFMIDVGSTAPGFTLKDQFARDVSLDQFKGKRHVMLLFYPLDFTPT
jgi:hypothetical protein